MGFFSVVKKRPLSQKIPHACFSDLPVNSFSGCTFWRGLALLEATKRDFGGPSAIIHN